MPQVVQFPMQQTIPVQVPISTANGQTLYQTIHFPVQAFATAIPNIIQASSSQMQMIPQLSQVGLEHICMRCLIYTSIHINNGATTGCIVAQSMKVTNK
jgi:hypothetical protein